MMPLLFAIMMVSADCWTAQESLRTESSAEFHFGSIACRFSVHSRSAPLRSDFSAPSRGSRLNHVGDGFLICEFGTRTMKGTLHPVCRNSASSFAAAAPPVSCPNKTSPCWPLSNMVSASSSDEAWPSSAGIIFRFPPQDVANEKKTFLLVPGKQD